MAIAFGNLKTKISAQRPLSMQIILFYCYFYGKCSDMIYFLDPPVQSNQDQSYHVHSHSLQILLVIWKFNSVFFSSELLHLEWNLPQSLCMSLSLLTFAYPYFIQSNQLRHSRVYHANPQDWKVIRKVLCVITQLVNEDGYWVTNPSCSIG